MCYYQNIDKPSFKCTCICKYKINHLIIFILGEAICSVYIQPEGFGPPPKQGYKDYQQRYSQTIDKRFVNGSTTTTTTTIEDFKVCFSLFLIFTGDY